MSTTEGGRGAVAMPGRLVAAEHRHHLVAHDAQHGLVGGEALQDVLADGARPDPLQELLDHLEVDVGFEQGEADLPQRRVDLALARGSPGRAGTGRSLWSLSLRVSNTTASNAIRARPASASPAQTNPK